MTLPKREPAGWNGLIVQPTTPWSVISVDRTTAAVFVQEAREQRRAELLGEAMITFCYPVAISEVPTGSNEGQIFSPSAGVQLPDTDESR
jgi:hypothetical protein